MKNIYDGLKVLDLSRFIAGPYCGMMLGDLGADVVKVEKAGSGDLSRALSPKINGESLYHFVLNRNKRSLTLDFRSEKGQEILLDLMEQADIIIENFRPGTLEKMGCGVEEIQKRNPKAIIVRISGFGQKGPYSERPGFDALAQAMSGLMSITGDPQGPPMLGGTFYIDYATAMYSTIGVLTALQYRSQTGRGQVIESTLLGSAVSLLLTAIPAQMMCGETINRVGNRDRYSAPANTFITKDQDWVIFIAGTDQLFERFVKAADKEYLLDDDRFNTHDSRLENATEIEKIVSEWIAQFTTSEILKITTEAGITCSKVETIKDVVDNPQLKYEEKIIKVEHPKVGAVPMVEFPINFSDTEIEMRYPAPTLGEHSTEILKEWLGLNEVKIQTLKQGRII